LKAHQSGSILIREKDVDSNFKKNPVAAKKDKKNKFEVGKPDPRRQTRRKEKRNLKRRGGKRTY